MWNWVLFCWTTVTEVFWTYGWMIWSFPILTVHSVNTFLFLLVTLRILLWCGPSSIRCSAENTTWRVWDKDKTRLFHLRIRRRFFFKSVSIYTVFNCTMLPSIHVSSSFFFPFSHNSSKNCEVRQYVINTRTSWKWPGIVAISELLDRGLPKYVWIEPGHKSQPNRVRPGVVPSVAFFCRVSASDSSIDWQIGGSKTMSMPHSSEK